MSIPAVNSSNTTYTLLDTSLTTMEPQARSNETVSSSVRVVMALGYSMVFVLALVGNSLVIAVVWRFSHMHTVTNYFLVNLAVADILMSLFCLPFTLAYHMMSPTQWVFGQAMCKVVPFLQGTFVSASVNTLAVIAFDRYLAICHRYKCSKKMALVIIPLIWLISGSVTIPWLITYRLEVGGNNTVAHCVEEGWANQTDKKAYLIGGTFLVCYLVPLVCVTVSYTLIGIKICRRKAIGEQNSATVIQQSKAKVLKMLITIVALFALLWLPLYIVMILYDFMEWDSSNTAFQEAVYEVYPFATLFATMSCCVNPIVYCALSKNYRDAFKMLLTCQVKLNNNTSNRSRDGYQGTSSLNSKRQEQKKKLLQGVGGNSFDSCRGTSITRVTIRSDSSSSDHAVALV